MFYVKEQLNDAMEVSVEINEENVYCRCPKRLMRWKPMSVRALWRNI